MGLYIRVVNLVSTVVEFADQFIINAAPLANSSPIQVVDYRSRE
jgi:hypothetical protein